MARPGASCLESFSVAVRFPKRRPWNAGAACQVWAKEWSNIGMLIPKERCSFINFTVKRSFVNIPFRQNPLFHRSIIPIFQIAEPFATQDKLSGAKF